MWGNVQETCGLGEGQELVQMFPHSRTWGFTNVSGHQQSSRMSRICVPSKRGHVLKWSQLTGMWQGAGISSQNCPNLICATLGEGNKRLQNFQTSGPAQLLLKRFFVPLIKWLCRFFLPYPYNSLLLTKFFCSLCCICSESVVEFKRPVACLLLYSYETKRVDPSNFL